MRQTLRFIEATINICEPNCNVTHFFTFANFVKLLQEIANAKRQKVF